MILKSLCLNPFEVREVLQARTTYVPTKTICLNPFEVREVLQVITAGTLVQAGGLNPFEVREVLQEVTYGNDVSLKCLNPFEVREVLQGSNKRREAHQLVSIPLKSGRCCKSALQNFLIKINNLFVNFR